MFVMDRFGRCAYAQEAGYGSDDAGRILPRFVTSSDVHDLKLRLDPYVIALDKVVAECPDMPAPIADGWRAFSRSWRDFFMKEEGFWTAGAEMDQAEAYQADLQMWTDKISRSTCKAGKPSAALPPAPSTEGETDKGVSDLTTAVEVVAGVVVVVAVGYYADKAGLFGLARRKMA
jgi:hypothetical protein